MISIVHERLFAEDLRINGYRRPIDVRSYRAVPHGLSVPIVVYFHGGMFTTGSIDDATEVCTELAFSGPNWVISVDYSLAPEYEFPAAVEDGYRALQWAITEAPAIGADRRRIALAGSEAGGNIATSVAALARDRGIENVGAQLLFAPLLDPSMTRIGIGAVDLSLYLEEIYDAYRAYLPTFSQQVHPYAAPLESCRLKGLPPAFIASSAGDPLRPEAERYAAVLIEAGVPTEAIRYAIRQRTDLLSTTTAVSDAVSFLRRYLPEKPSTRT